MPPTKSASKRRSKSPARKTTPVKKSPKRSKSPAKRATPRKSKSPAKKTTPKKSPATLKKQSSDLSGVSEPVSTAAGYNIILGLCYTNFGLCLLAIPFEFLSLYWKPAFLTPGDTELPFALFLIRNFGMILLSLGLGGMTYPNDKGTSTLMLSASVLFLLHFGCIIGGAYGEEGTTWTWFWYPQLALNATFVALSWSAFKGTSAPEPSAKPDPFTQEGANKLLGLAYGSFALAVLFIPTEFFRLYWSDALVTSDPVVKFMGRNFGLCLLATGYSGLTAQTSVGTSFFQLLVSTFAFIHFCGVIADEYGKAEEAWIPMFWYPQILMNFGFVVLAALGFSDAQAKAKAD